MKIILSLAAAAVAFTATPALADKGGKGHDKEWKHGGDRDGGRYRDGRDGDGRYRDGRHYSNYRNCPPGLAKKHNGCMAPGQAKKRWARGQRVPYGYNGYTSYNNIPREYRDRYDLNRNDRYIYENGTVYRVDRRTSVIEQVLGGLLR